MDTDKTRALSYLCASVCICGLFCFPAKAQDAHEIIVRAFALNQRAQRQNYTYLQRQHIRMLDGKGNVKSEKTQTEDITFIDGSTYRRLVARNDKPLSPEEQKAEDERLRRTDAERRKETPEQRQARIADWRRRRDERNAPYQEVPDAFNFKLTGEEKIDGVPAYVIDATPKPDFKPKSSAASMLLKFEGRLWIAKSDYGMVKMEAQTLGTVSYRGILFRLAKGSRVRAEMEKVNDEVWMPKSVTVQLAGRVLLLMGVHADADFTFRDYKKFQTDSRMVSTGEKP